MSTWEAAFGAAELLLGIIGPAALGEPVNLVKCVNQSLLLGIIGPAAAALGCWWRCLLVAVVVATVVAVVAVVAVGGGGHPPYRRLHVSALQW